MLNRSFMTSNVPPPFPQYPLESYHYPIDRLRHWIWTRGGEVFTTAEVRAGTGLDASNTLGKMAKRGEVAWVSHGTYRAQAGLRDALEIVFSVYRRLGY
jgi:hypothetical protein